jgi:hypothetical protein
MNCFRCSIFARMRIEIAAALGTGGGSRSACLENHGFASAAVERLLAGLGKLEYLAQEGSFCVTNGEGSRTGFRRQRAVGMATFS